MPRPAVIRPLTPDDLPAVLALNTEAAPAVSRLSAAELRQLAAQATMAWVAVVDQRVAAYLIVFASTVLYDGEGFRWFQAHLARFLYVDQIAVAAQSRGEGIGADLYAALERRAVEDDWDCLTCEVNVVPSNPSSLAFHRRQGFLEMDRMQTADGRRVALLHKRLPAAV